MCLSYISLANDERWKECLLVVVVPRQHGRPPETTLLKEYVGSVRQVIIVDAGVCRMIEHAAQGDTTSSPPTH